MQDSSSDTQPPAALWRPIAYSSGNLGKAALWTTFESVLLFYLVSLCAMPPAMAGMILSGIMVWDGCADLLIAYAGDRWDSRRGQRGWIMLAAPLCGSGFAAIFALGWASQGTGWIGITLAIMLTRVGYTVCDVAHNSLLTVFSQSARSASTVSGLRFLFSSLGAALVGLGLSQSLGLGAITAQRASLALFATIAAALYVATLVAAGLATPAAPSGSAPPAAPPFLEAMAILLREKSFRSLLVLMAVQSLFSPMFVKGLVFFGRTWRGGPQWAGGSLVELTFAQGLTMPVLMMLAHRGLSARAILCSGHVLLALGITCIAFYPHGEADPLALVLVGAGYAAMNMGIWAMLGRQCRTPVMASNGMPATPYGMFLAVLKTFTGCGTMLLSAAIAQSGTHTWPYVIEWVVLGGPALGAIIATALNLAAAQWAGNEAHQPS